MKCHLQVFATEHKGWAVRALHFIPRGTFICAYNGQILTDELANKAVVDHFLAGLDHIEVAIAQASAAHLPLEQQPMKGEALNSKQILLHFVNSKLMFFSVSVGRVGLYGQEHPYVIDGSRYSNVGRLFNHSCSPNMFTQNVFVETHDLRFSHIGFFASWYVHISFHLIHFVISIDFVCSDVSPFEELTWDYNWEMENADKSIYCNCSDMRCKFHLR